jgi:hypothetical protein
VTDYAYPSSEAGNIWQSCTAKTLGPCSPTFKNGFNEALAQRKKVPEHLDDLLFYLDYIDSDFSNAVAFRDGSSAFIGITVPLVYELLKICALLSDSEPIRRILGLENTQELRDWLNVVLFRHLLSLVVTHEFTHHVHGHVLKHQSQSKFFSEFVAGNQNSNIERQAEEADADGYAAYHVLANFIDGGARKNISAVLKLDSAAPDVVDQVPFSCFVIVAGAFLFRPPRLILQRRISLVCRTPRKPPGSTYLMRHSILRCEENWPSPPNCSRGGQRKTCAAAACRDRGSNENTGLNPSLLRQKVARTLSHVTWQERIFSGPAMDPDTRKLLHPFVEWAKSIT